MKLTEKLGLKKPDLTDYVNIGDLNDNMDVLDEEVGNLKEGTTEVVDLETLDKTYKGAINEINQEVKSHKAEKASQNGYGHIRLQDIPTPTKSSIGLGNVDNVKQMPISGGVLENYTEKLITTTGTINLSLGNVFYRNATANTFFFIENTVDNCANSFTLIIEMGSVARTLTFPNVVKWAGGEISDMTKPNKTYVLTFLSTNGGLEWFGMFGGEF